MAQDFGEYLAVNVLSEQQYVNYRNLSRALKVHSNLAKQMLYDFHRKQNNKKPGSVHATYLITGTKRPAITTITQSQDIEDEDSIMRSSPPLPSSSFQRPEEQVEDVAPIRGVTLVREEHLEEAKTQFESISGMHIYSLQVNGLSDMQVLTECNRRVASEYATEDPLKDWRQYGIVQNQNVRRRTKGQSSLPPPAVKFVPAAKSGAVSAAKETVVEKQAESKPATKNALQQRAAASAPSKMAAGKNQNSSLFKSFAKGSANAKKKAESQGSSAAASPATEPDDVPMTGFSDDDDDDAESALPTALDEVKASTGESKEQRKSKLEAMMDEEDEVMDDAATPGSVVSQHDEGAIDVAEQKEEAKESVTVENGRRRGRRRVMKKKTVKDEDGYLVTREEAAWESFSEDEPAPKKARTSTIGTSKAASKKAAGKPGQGNIMSFFSKK